MYSIYNIHSNRDIWVSTYEELVAFCNGIAYKEFLQMINKKDYALCKIK